VSRARANIDRSKVRHVTPVDRQEELLTAFEAAVASGSTDRLAALLSDDIALYADGGGKVQTIRRVLHGKAEVLAFIAENLREYWRAYAWAASDINGGKGVVLYKDGQTAASVSFAYDEAGKATNIYIMRNPDKLARLSVIRG
jgi:RNA polymerase sigma-70 factor (ECF subfamily)